MTTKNHLNNFIKIDSKIQDDLKSTAENLLEVENLDLENTEYLAKALFCLGRYSESIRQFEKILEKKAKDKDALKNIAINHFHKKDYRMAMKYFDAALETDPGNESVLSYKMLCHEFLGEYNQAAMLAEEILEASPKNISVIKRLIDYHLRLKNYDECLHLIGQIKYDSYKKAVVLFESRRYEECIEEARKIRTSESYMLAGRAHRKLGNTAKAVRYLHKSYELDLNVDTLFEISDIYFEAEDPVRAIYFLNEVLLHDDSNVEAYSRIARAYMKSGDWSDAVEYGKKALEISKKVSDVYIVLAEAYIQLDGCNMKRAIEIVEEGISENPESWKLWVERGDVHYMHDEYAFRQSYEKAISLNPNETSIYLKYIDMLLMEDESETAKIYYNQLLLVNPLFEKTFDELQEFWS